MEILYSEVEKIYNSLNKITKIKLPIKIAIKLSRLLNIVESEYKLYITHRNMIINECALRDENNNIIQEKVMSFNGTETNSIPIKKECHTKWTEEMQELLNIKFTVDFSPISLDELNINVAIEDINGLEKFLI